MCVKGAISQKNPDQSCGGFTHLFDSDADSDRVDRSLNENLLLVITTDDHRLEQQLFTAPVTTTPFSHLENPGLLTFKLSDPADFCRGLQNTSAEQNVASLHRPILQPCPHLLCFPRFFFSSYIF